MPFTPPRPRQADPLDDLLAGVLDRAAQATDDPDVAQWLTALRQRGEPAPAAEPSPRECAPRPVA
jgi:hypothetical protein